MMGARGYRLGAVLLLATGGACGGRATFDRGTPGCVSDAECKADSVCQLGGCVRPLVTLPGGVAAPVGQASPVDPPPTSSEGCTSIGCSGATPPPGSGNAPSSGGSTGGASSANDSGTGGTGTDASSPAPPVDLGELTRSLPGATTIVSDPLRDRIYVAMGAAAPSFPNSLVVFNLDEGTPIADVPIGANPDSLAISDDGSTLWVGLHDTSSVRKVDVSGNVPVPGAEYVLPPGDYAPRPDAAGPMVVLPGTTSSLAVTLHIDDLSPSLVGVVLLDEGVPRPVRLPGHTGASRLTRGPSGYLLGFNNLHGGFGMYSVAITPDGLTQTEHQNLISGFETDIVYDSGLLFGTDGAVINVQDPEAPFAVGRFPAQGPVFPDVAAGRVWVLTGAQSHAYPALLSLAQLDLRTFEVVAVTDLADEVLVPRHLIQSRGGVLAFIADLPEQTSTGFEFASGVYWVQPRRER